jgi:hypothetical protein
MPEKFLLCVIFSFTSYKCEAQILILQDYMMFVNKNNKTFFLKGITKDIAEIYL